jgi:hypothetical protein
MKTCSHCRQIKTLNFFGKDRSRKDGLQHRCKDCEENVFRARPKKRYDSYRWNAKARGLLFRLSFRDFMKLWQTECYYCGEIVKTIGIDRIDNTKGYVFGNILSCCKDCNMIKKNFPKDKFIAVAIKIAKRHSNTPL